MISRTCISPSTSEHGMVQCDGSHVCPSSSHVTVTHWSQATLCHTSHMCTTCHTLVSQISQSLCYNVPQVQCCYNIIVPNHVLREESLCVNVTSTQSSGCVCAGCHNISMLPPYTTHPVSPVSHISFLICRLRFYPTHACPWLHSLQLLSTSEMEQAGLSRSPLLLTYSVYVSTRLKQIVTFLSLSVQILSAACPAMLTLIQRERALNLILDNFRCRQCLVWLH